MTVTQAIPDVACDLQAPKRNHFFHGKLMDVYHFRLETEYLNYMRRMLNRLVTGYGVICGLDVKLTEGSHGKDAIAVCPGMAIDKAGREIIVPEESRPVGIPPELLPAPKSQEEEREACSKAELHLVLCHKECLAEPVPVQAGICCEEEPCQPGVVFERYELAVRSGHIQNSGGELVVEDLVQNGRFDYESLVKLVSKECPCCPKDTCIPLANLSLEWDGDKQHWQLDKIDITIRPICLTNDLLFQLLLSAIKDSPGFRAQK